MYATARIDDPLAEIPAEYVGHSRGYRRQVLFNRETGSAHLTLSVGQLDEGGSIDAVVHSHETSVYVLSGTLAVTTLGQLTHLGPDHCMVLPVGEAYAAAAVDGPVRWLQMVAPGEIGDGRRRDTFFTGETLTGVGPVVPDMRDPRNRNAVRFDASSMDLRRLAGGSDVNAPTVSPSMATALLAYSGIGVKMLLDQNTGAQLHTLFMVDYQPTAIAHPHDHPFEEAYVFLLGRVHALVDGEEIAFGPGDVLWCGVGADHGFENRGDELVRWIEVQAPQPPARHSYRFSREWEHLSAKLEG
ncbi:MAG: hypothetical protein B7Z69_06460 [Actinobacteria bacterium 21-73-9]|nr:MAG: hypothetical protein B7Z69_06460 [Actinobacteria bacterium 21-73-9]